MEEQLLAGLSIEWLIQSAADPMVIVDSARRIVLLNPALEKLFDYPKDELLAQNLERLLPEHLGENQAFSQPAFLPQPQAQALGSGMDLYGRRKDGREFPVDLSFSPLNTVDGRRLVLITVQDITPRKQAKQALLDSEARMRAIVDTAVDAIITIDGKGIIERFNPAAERIFGYSQVEVAGKNVSFLMPSPYREMHDGYLSNYQRTGEKKIIGVGREVIGLRKDGTTFPIDLSVAEMQVGEYRMFTGIVRDISERKQGEERLARLLHEVSGANEELTNFAYVVSHDLKAPLRAIGSLADWLAIDYADKFDEEGQEHMRLLLSRVHRMSSLIDGILQYSRVGRIKETPVEVNLNQLVREVIDMLKPPVNFAITIENTLPVVFAERTRMQQVFQNLISNAIKYMDKPEGKIQIACLEEDGQWRFSVADNGPGIEERHFERIFELFQTLAPRDRVESTGVGLALVKKIVELYRGRVWVESRMGHGTAFLFSLPFGKTEATNRNISKEALHEGNQ